MTTYYVYGVEPSGTSKGTNEKVSDTKSYRLLAEASTEDIASGIADRFRRIYGQVIVDTTKKAGTETTVEGNAPF